MKDNVQQFILNENPFHIQRIHREFPKLYGVNHIDEIISKDERERDKNIKRKDHFYYIPKYPETFLQCLIKINKIYGNRKSFMDVGCGIGDKVLLSHYTNFFSKCYGIEYSDYTYNIAKEKIEPITGQDTIFKGDAFEHDFSPYDTIYLYCPIRERKPMKELLLHVYNTMKEDAIILFFNAVIYDWEKWTRENNLKYARPYSYVITKR